MLNLKPYRQKPELCGPACLKMVLEYFGIEKPEAKIARLYGYKPAKGVSAEGLIKAAKQLGLKAFSKDFTELKDIKEYVLNKKTTVIVDWFSVDDGHYSVVVDIDKENVYLQDPEIGHIRSMRLEVFKRVWFDFPGDFLKSKSDIIIRRMIVVCK